VPRLAVESVEKLASRQLVRRWGKPLELVMDRMSAKMTWGRYSE
jgi:hypothetical protein